MSKFNNGPVFKIIVALIVVGGAIGLIYRSAGLPTPDEANRVRTTGPIFSIIAPPGWDVAVKYSPIEQAYAATIQIDPVKTVGRPERLFVGRLNKAPDTKRLEQNGSKYGMFQDLPAWIYAAPAKHEYVWQAIFQRNGDWYEISLRVGRAENVPQSDWWAYINSFRAEAHPPTTAPMITPITTQPASRFSLQIPQ